MLYPYDGVSFHYTFHNEEVSVLKSGALGSPTVDAAWTADDKLIIFYQRPKGLVGASIPYDKKDTPDVWAWTDLSELED